MQPPLRSLKPSDPLAHRAKYAPAAVPSSRAQAASAPASGKKKVIYDQDHRGPLSTDTSRNADAFASGQHRFARHLHGDVRHVGEAGNGLRAAVCWN